MALRCYICGRFDKPLNMKTWFPNVENICEPNELIDGLWYHSRCQIREWIKMADKAREKLFRAFVMGEFQFSPKTHYRKSPIEMAMEAIHPEGGYIVSPKFAGTLLLKAKTNRIKIEKMLRKLHPGRYVQWVQINKNLMVPRLVPKEAYDGKKSRRHKSNR